MSNETLAKVAVSMTKLVLYAVWNAAFACIAFSNRDKKVSKMRRTQRCVLEGA